MSENKQFKLHIKWYNKEKTEGEFVLKDGGQPLGVIESIEDARLIRDTLNELYDENEQLKQYIKNSYMGSVCDNCEHCKEIHTNDWFNGIVHDVECEKGHIDMDISDCEDFKLTSMVFGND